VRCSADFVVGRFILSGAGYASATLTKGFLKDMAGIRNVFSGALLAFCGVW